MAFVEERGRFDGPITITNTHSCGLTRDVTAQWLFSQLETSAKNDQPFWLPVAAETYDGNLNDVNGHHVKAEHVIAAFEDAAQRSDRRGQRRRRYGDALLRVQGRLGHRVARGCL